MRRAWPVLLLLVAGGAEPTAKLAGPERVKVSEPILLSIAGTVSDVPPVVEWASGPVEVPVVALYTSDGALAYGLAACVTPGEYQFACIAEGASRGGAKPVRKYAFWTVAVGVSRPPPEPPPRPDAPTDDPPLQTPTGLSRAAWSAKGLAERPVAIREAEADKIARNYLEVCNDASIKDVATFKARITDAAWRALGRSEEVWGDWMPTMSSVVRELNSLGAALGREATVAECKAWYKEISLGYSRSKS